MADPDRPDDASPDPHEQRAAGSLRRFGRRVEALRDVPIELLAEELIDRAESIDPYVAGHLAMALEPTFFQHANRFGARRLFDVFHGFHHFDDYLDIPIEGATVLDLGCGAENPLALSMLYVLLGAERAIGVDLEEVRDLGRAVRGMSRCAAYMLMDPRLLVGDYALSRDQAVERLDSFDLHAMAQGIGDGVDLRRVAYRRESADALSFGDAEVDLVVSHSFLEHVARADDVVAELARVTRPGGHSCHNIDGSDHRRYGDPTVGALAFLTEDSSDALVHGCNRIRPLEFVAIFERHGFEVLHTVAWNPVALDTAGRANLAPRFRSLDEETLSQTQARFVARRI